jgi:hypothetical protein
MTNLALVSLEDLGGAVLGGVDHNKPHDHVGLLFGTEHGDGSSLERGVG